MKRTGSHLKIGPMGTNVLGVRLECDPAKPEPEEFRVAFPGGDVSVVRCSDGSVWAHVRVDHERNHEIGDVDYQIVDARLDIVGKHAAEADLGDFENAGLYHLAVRIKERKP